MKKSAPMLFSYTASSKKMLVKMDLEPTMNNNYQC